MRNYRNILYNYAVGKGYILKEEVFMDGAVPFLKKNLSKKYLESKLEKKVKKKK